MRSTREEEQQRGGAPKRSNREEDSQQEERSQRLEVRDTGSDRFFPRFHSTRYVRTGPHGSLYVYTQLLVSGFSGPPSVPWDHL